MGAGNGNDDVVITLYDVILHHYSYPGVLQVTMADIFDLIIRSGTYDVQFRYALTLKSFSQSLLSSRSCDEQKYVLIVIVTDLCVSILSLLYPLSLSLTLVVLLYQRSHIRLQLVAIDLSV